MEKQTSHKVLRKMLGYYYDRKIPMFISGGIGIGKSTVVREVAGELGIQFRDVRISQLDPTDLRGLPMPDRDRNETVWLYPNWLPKEGNGILFLDELNLAPPMVQAAAYQLILDRRIGDYILPEGWYVVAAGNRLEDRANIFQIPAPLSNRFTHITLDAPAVQDWTEWAVKNDIDQRILAFINFRPDYLYKFDQKIRDNAFPTPRSWEFASKLIKGSKDTEHLKIAVASACGDAASDEFMAFLELTEKTDIKEVLRDTEHCNLPTRVDMLYSLINGLFEYYRTNYRKESDLLGKVLVLMGRLKKAGMIEFSVLLLRMVKAIDPGFLEENLPKEKLWEEQAPDYAKVIS